MKIETFALDWEIRIKKQNEYLQNLIIKLEKSDKSISFVSSDELEKVYSIGYDYFSLGNYQACKNIIELLTKYASKTNHYWRALGAVNQEMKKYDEAIVAYKKAIEINKNDIVSHSFLADTYFLSGEREKGIDELNIMLNIHNDDPSSHVWIDRVKLILISLNLLPDGDK